MTGIETLPPAKRLFAEKLLVSLESVPGFLSASLVGSFCETEGLDGISDIDTVVILRKLDASVFALCRKVAESMRPLDLGLDEYTLIVNDTLGPRKMDSEKKIVIHLMVYDREGHRRHVLQSPFTCLDWERSPVFAGRSLREIYPALPLMPRDFREARRGLGDYLQDLRNRWLGYRSYRFEGDKVLEEKHEQPIDARHAGEFSYHIVSNLIQNYGKLIRGDNHRLSLVECVELWKDELGGSDREGAWFFELARLKRERSLSFPEDTVDQTEAFVKRFTDHFQKDWEDASSRWVFLRHGRTAENNGSFLGQRRDPGLLGKPEPLSETFSRVFSSPLKRARETAEALAPEAGIQLDPRLLEIDYGQAEGLDPAQLAASFPEIPKAWSRGEDASFPGGENSLAVETRLEGFIEDQIVKPVSGPTLVVTHNVVIRCLLGKYLGIPMRHWHQIAVPHTESFEFRRKGKRLYPNLSLEQKSKLLDSLQNEP